MADACRRRFYSLEPLMDCKVRIRDEEKCVRLFFGKDFLYPVVVSLPLILIKGVAGLNEQFIDLLVFI